MIPYDSKRTLNLKVPMIGIIVSVFLWVIGSTVVISTAIDTLEYYTMKEKLGFYSSQFNEWKNTIFSLKKTDNDLKKILSSGNNKEEILENADINIDKTDMGSINFELLKDEIKNTIKNVDSVRAYLKQQKNVYISTPKGLPADGRITSDYGERESIRYGGKEFHSGMDIATPKGTGVKATADGVVSFSGWSAGNGNLVVIEHGFGYSTLYAHNSSIIVNIGDKIKRGQIISYSGSTGYSTGPHIHYEIWLNGKSVNPKKYLSVRRK